jgi:ACT domain-containing protein
VALARAQAQAPERWLHIKVDSKDAEGEVVRVNVPLSMAEKVLPAIHSKDLQGGKVKIKAHTEDIDLRAILDAVRTAADNEFVTVQSKKENVRVAKSGGYLLVKVTDNGEKAENVDIKVPFTVVEALLSAGEDELDVAAAIRALNAHGDTELVTVTDQKETVRIWVDSKNTEQ